MGRLTLVLLIGLLLTVTSSMTKYMKTMPVDHQLQCSLAEFIACTDKISVKIKILIPFGNPKSHRKDKFGHINNHFLTVNIHTVKKVIIFLVPSWDVTNQNSPWQELIS
jgi:hypothetical protein